MASGSRRRGGSAPSSLPHQAPVRTAPQRCSVLLLLLGLGILILLLPHPPGASADLSTNDVAAYRERARRMFYHGFDNYMTHAFPKDELDPLLCVGRGPDPDPDNWGVNDVLGNFSLTLIDALGTFVVLGDGAGFERAVRQVLDVVSFAQDTKVQVFEVNIRVLGSLLSAHQLASSPEFGFGLPWYAGELLALATDLAERLVPAFDTPTRIPYARVNLVSGVPESEHPETCTAATGTLLLEFAVLSRLTGRPKFERLARDALMAVWERRSPRDLLGGTINVLTGEWVVRFAGMGAGVDSFYEYLLKAAILLGEQEYLDLFHVAYASMREHQLAGPDDFIFRNVDMASGHTANTWVDALGAFMPGMQVLLGDLEGAIKLHAFYHALWRRYDMMPERFDYQHKSATIKTYLLRPEFIESTYYLYRATRDPYYLEVGAEVLENLEANCWTPCGYAAISDILARDQGDKMESFFLSETVKYLYLLFDEDNWLNHLDTNWVFTTEAQFLALPGALQRPTAHAPFSSPAPATSPVSGREQERARGPTWRTTCSVHIPRFRNLTHHVSMCGALEPLVDAEDLAHIARHTKAPDLPFVADLRLTPLSGAEYQEGWIGDFHHGLVTSELVGLYLIVHFDKRADAYVVRRMNGREVEEGRIIHATEYALLFLTSSVPLPQMRQLPGEGDGEEAKGAGPGTGDRVVDPPVLLALALPHAGSRRSTLRMEGVLAQFGPCFAHPSDRLRASLAMVPGAFPSKKSSFFSRAPPRTWYGCAPYAPAERTAVQGRIILVPRGECMFTEKAVWAEQAGAVALVVVNTEPGTPAFPMSAVAEEEFGLARNAGVDSLSIPALMVSEADGAKLVGALQARPDQTLSIGLAGPAASGNQLYFNNKPIRNLKIVKFLGQWAKRQDPADVASWRRPVRTSSYLLDVGVNFPCLRHCPLPGTSCAGWGAWSARGG